MQVAISTSDYTQMIARKSRSIHVLARSFRSASDGGNATSDQGFRCLGAYTLAGVYEYLEHKVMLKIVYPEAVGECARFS